MLSFNATFWLRIAIMSVPRQNATIGLRYSRRLRWLPARLLQAGQQAALTEALFAASRHKQVQLHFNKGLAGGSATGIAAARETATNPAVLDAFVLVIIADGEGSIPAGRRPIGAGTIRGCGRFTRLG